MRTKRRYVYKQKITQDKNQNMAQLRKIYCAYLLLIFSALPVQAAEEKGLLWEISGLSKIKPSYLFATIHVDHPKVINLPEKFKTIFRKADSFSGEVILDKNAQQEMVKYMLFPKGENLQSYLSAWEFHQCQEIMRKRDIPEHVLNRFKPWAIVVAMGAPKSKSEMILDKLLIDEAEKQGKAVYGLETVSEQVSAFINMPLTDQAKMLKEAIKLNHLFNSMFKELLKAYLAGDLSELLRLDKKYQSKENQKIEDYLRKELLVKRNFRMLERMQPRLKEGNAFIAVGALHLPGATGLISLLREKGYSVKAVY